MEVLNFICSSSLDAVYLMKDLHRYLEDPLLVRKLRDLCRSFRQKRKSLVLTAPTFDLPPELSNEVVFFELSLPAVDELKTLVLRVVRDISSRRKIAVKMDAATGRKLVESLRGLPFTRRKGFLPVPSYMMDDCPLTTCRISLMPKSRRFPNQA